MKPQTRVSGYGKAAGSWVEPRSSTVLLIACILFIPILFFFHEMRTSTHFFGNADVDEGLKVACSVVEDNGMKNNTAAGGIHVSSTNYKKGSWIECDLEEVRTCTCEIRGDVRIHGTSSSIVLLPPNSDGRKSRGGNGTNTSSIQIRPYPRKWEESTMLMIRELTILQTWSDDYYYSTHSSNSNNNNNTSNSFTRHNCDSINADAAIVFSTGGFRSNFYHEIVDALIPLFLTSHRFNGNAHFLIEDFNPTWVNRYLPVLQKLSKHDIINLDKDGRVHCFSHVVVGLNSTMEMGIDPDKSPWGPSMLEFKALLRRSFELPRNFATSLETTTTTTRGKNRPRILLISREKTRVLLNEKEMIDMVQKLGYEVVKAGLETAKNLTLMARLVNSCDVMLGVHGAGLTNMVFLPSNGTLIQIIPWGEMLNPSLYSYGDPAVGMGLRYTHYEITMNETSLLAKYPRDHVVFKNPLAIHRQGFYAMWLIFWHQDIMLDVHRFGNFLSQALHRK